MGKAVFRGIQGIFLGYLLYLLFCFILRIRVDNGTGGCIAIITGMVFFVVSLSRGKTPGVLDETIKGLKQVESERNNPESSFAYRLGSFIRKILGR